MGKRFNTTGLCIPSMHYMVNIEHKLEKIQELITNKDYFIINRPRQYGKTTTMFMLEQRLKNEYLVISISFEGIGDDIFQREEDFSKTFLELISDNLQFSDEESAQWINDKIENVKNLKDLSKIITKFIKTRSKVSNRIFEQRLYNYFSSKLEGVNNMAEYNIYDSFYTENGLDFMAVLLKFQQFIKEQYSTIDSKFIEREGRLLFLSFIKPIINGVGFDFKEVQISEERRLDVVVTYLREKYIVELKICRGEEYHQKGLNQLVQYLENQNMDTGYLLIYNFNKNKQYKNEEIFINNKKIFIVWV